MKTDLEILELFPPTIGMQSVGRIVTLAYHLMQVADVPGDVCEFGTHKGYTAVLLTALTRKEVWVYDSFKGSPAHEEAVNEKVFYQGSNKVEPRDIVNAFAEAGVTVPKIIPGWFSEVKPEELPEKIAFAHLDGDFYVSISDSLALVYPRLSQGAVVVIDDYGWDELPGVKLAADEFLKDKPEKVTVTRGVKGVVNPQGYFTRK